MRDRWTSDDIVGLIALAGVPLYGLVWSWLQW